ncbi:hypothetical protein AHAS_Ahas14G0144700 [Arachis hypogaea]
MQAKVPKNFKTLDMDLCDRMTDPRHHLNNFKSRMYLTDAFDAICCKAFPTTLTKAAMKWFDNLLSRSITSFDDLARKFLISFPDEVQERAEKYINIEENSRLREPFPRPNLPYQAREKEKEPKKNEEQNSKKTPRYHNYTPLRVSLVDVYREIYHMKKLPPPRPIKHKKARSRTEYCEYHKLYGHPTNECYDLKNVIEKLAREGRLDRYLADRSGNLRKRRMDEEEGRQEHPRQTPRTTHTHMINGGLQEEECQNHHGKGISKRYTKSGRRQEYPACLLSRSLKKTPKG